MHFRLCVFSLMMISFPVQGIVSAKKFTREEYISKHKNWAVEEMVRSGIPASITLAQGLLESNNGNSTLAVQGNNHFGIKCHDWKGKTMRHDDDKRRECFRKYKSTRESYTDHTDFLMNSPRYSFLFELEHTDYKGWATGLKKAGYATAPQYANLLIRIIEENELYRLDEGKRIGPERTEELELADIEDFEISIKYRKILVRNRIDYIIVKEGDTYQSITGEYDLMPFELARYNEIERDAKLSKGQELYLQTKRSKASVEFRFHTVEEGETMYRISQMYGIKLRKLYQKNLMAGDEEPAPGTVLSLRKKRKTDTEEEANESGESVEIEFEKEE